MNASNLYLRTWLLSGIVLIALMVMIGGITRLTGSGLSMVEWKPVTGVIPPLNETDWHREFEKYQQFPEYQKLNYGMSLADFKKIYFWEFLHRLLGRLIGVVFILPFVVFYFKGWITRTLTGPLLLIFALGALQGFMGWYMVQSGLDKIPHVSHFRLAAHQGLAFLIIVLLYWLYLSLGNQPKAHSRRPASVFTLTLLSLGLLVVQILLGAFVAGLKAGYSYSNFPWMGDSFFPSQAVVPSESFFYNGAVLQFVHRWLAFVVALSMVLLYRQAARHTLLRRPAQRLLALVGLQLVLGVATLMLQVPVTLGVAHQFVALLLLLQLVALLRIMRSRTPS